MVNGKNFVLFKIEHKNELLLEHESRLFGLALSINSALCGTLLKFEIDIPLSVRCEL